MYVYIYIFWYRLVCVDFKHSFLLKNLVLSNLTPVFPRKICCNLVTKIYTKTRKLQNASQNFQK